MKQHISNRGSLPALILVALLLIGWQAAAMKVNAAYIIPSPTQILTRLWELRVPLFTVHLPATMLVTAVGLLISLLLGLTLAVVMDAFPLARKSLYPIIIASQTIPTTAHRASVRALVRLWHLEQGPGHCADHLLPHCDHRLRRLPVGQNRDGGASLHLWRDPHPDLLQAENSHRPSLFLFRYQDGNPDEYHWRGHRRVARRSKRSWLLLPPDDDPARRRPESLHPLFCSRRWRCCSPQWPRWWNER